MSPPKNEMGYLLKYNGNTLSERMFPMFPKTETKETKETFECFR